MRLLITTLYLTLVSASYAASSSNSPCEEVKRYLSSEPVHLFCQDNMLIGLSKKSNNVSQAIYSVMPNGHQTDVYDRSDISDIFNVDTAATSREQIHLLGYDFAHLGNEKLPNADIKSRSDRVNRVAMLASLNRQGGLWYQLEEYEIDQALVRGQFIAISGAIYSANVIVPSHFYKIYYQPSNNALSAFMVANSPEHVTSLSDAMTTVECIEKQIGTSLLGESGIAHLSDLKDSQAYSTQVWTQGDQVATGQCYSPINLQGTH